MKTTSATESEIQREGVRAILIRAGVYGCLDVDGDNRRWKMADAALIIIAFIIAAWLYIRVRARGTGY